MALKVVGSNPTNYPLSKIIFFKKNKIKRKYFKKKIHLIKKTAILKFNNTLLFKNLVFYTKKLQLDNTTKMKINDKLLVTLSQKLFNTKCTLFNKKILNTFSVGSVIKYFKVKQAKYVRRSVKGAKILLNFIKNLLNKIFLKKHVEVFILNIVGLDYNLVNLKKNIKNLLGNNLRMCFFLMNLKLSFTKKKDKKIKSIKKRLKKKLILNFKKNK